MTAPPILSRMFSAPLAVFTCAVWPMGAVGAGVGAAVGSLLSFCTNLVIT